MRQSSTCNSTGTFAPSCSKIVSLATVPIARLRQADLRLDKREVAVDKEAIKPGDPDASEMIRRIMSDDADEHMPPPETKKKLTAAEIQTLARWIKEGAKYESLWSLIAPVRSPVPKVGNSWWVRNPIDNFVAARLEEVGLTPAPEADRRTLCRRVSLDLTGLPPKPEVVEEFANDNDPDAYEHLVDKLLASPKWGEHRGRYWLDAARYADTHGIHFDNYREMWSYRDWVIKALNHNMPFDRVHDRETRRRPVAERHARSTSRSGFNRCNITTNEGGAIHEEYAVLYTRDRVETTSQGLDGTHRRLRRLPRPQIRPARPKRVLQMAAFFNNTTQSPMDGNIKDTPPIVTVPLASDANAGAKWPKKFRRPRQF